MAVTRDVQTYEYGVPLQPTSYSVGHGQQLYSGAVALVSGNASNAAIGTLRNAASPDSTDLVAGIVGEPAGGTYVKTGPGILGGTNDGDVWADVRTGAFFIKSGTGSDQLTVATTGKTVYYGGEDTTGPLAMATGSGRPILGVQLPQDPGVSGGAAPGVGYWPIKLNTIGGPGGP